MNCQAEVWAMTTPRGLGHPGQDNTTRLRRCKRRASTTREVNGSPHHLCTHHLKLLDAGCHWLSFVGEKP